VKSTKYEARNSKQYPMTQMPMTKTKALSFCFEHWGILILSLFRVSDFEIRI